MAVVGARANLAAGADTKHKDRFHELFNWKTSNSAKAGHGNGFETIRLRLRTIHGVSMGILSRAPMQHSGGVSHGAKGHLSCKLNKFILIL